MALLLQDLLHEHDIVVSIGFLVQSCCWMYGVHAHFYFFIEALLIWPASHSYPFVSVRSARRWGSIVKQYTWLCNNLPLLTTAITFFFGTMNIHDGGFVPNVCTLLPRRCFFFYQCHSFAEKHVKARVRL